MDKNENFITKTLNKIKSFWKSKFESFKKSSLQTKIAHFIMGFGHFTRKQITKGIIYLFIQISFMLFFFTSPQIPKNKKTPLGLKGILNLKTLGTDIGDIFTLGDNSLYILLYGVFTIVIVLGFLFIYGHHIKSSKAIDILIEENKKIPTFKEDLYELSDSRFHVTLLTPAIIGVLILTIIPNIFMILVAFTNFDSEHLPPGQLFEWVGFANFLNLFNKSSALSGFWSVLVWTLLWAVIATFTNYFLGILLATLINSRYVKAKKMWRTVFVLTIAIPQFVSLLLMKYLFAELGPINEILLRLGLIETRMNFLGNANNMWTARIMVILINLWVGIPYTMLMTSGILMNVPQELYEAAEIDGATKGQIFRKITMPYIIFVTTPYLISSFMGNITSFNIIFLLTGGGPGAGAGDTPGKTDLLVTWLFRLTVDQSNYNLGAVVSILTFVLMTIGTLITYRRSKSYKEEGAFQ